ncbi:MAG TPA: GNAT family N-acetyltransferase [Candidatus Rothia avistercoris]|uniref:GNAT family N-acetyltransferase n=1 Tax=Candidatus Rothia avistercoris TaxID=2840479 RepID=A0A9D2ZTK0_9MICC|nr:GNAT family N-acetyltransferase [Candidatus Rothia avistercoris]
MPLINVSYASIQSNAKKAELIAELTKTYARVMGAKESSIWVMLNEVPRTDWGVGGQALAAMDLAAKASETPRATVTIRQARAEDIPTLAAIEARCFPAAEAASEQALTERFKAFGEHFWVLEADNELVAFIDGLVTDSPVIFDELYENPLAHTRHGAYQTIFGINTLPEHRRKGYASQLIATLTEQARSQGRQGVILTCKEELISFYQNLGFELDGLSASTHGGARWHDMTLHFEN